MTMRILITGHEGYIGSVMAPWFVQAGHDVTGLDIGYFRDCNFTERGPSIKTIRKDIREVTVGDLKGFDAVVHLAALSNDPIGNLNSDWTNQINYQGSVRLAEAAKAAGVRRFLFSSSCIMYGMSEAAVATETSSLDPKTEYALSKVKAERDIAHLADETFSPTFLRNGTVYGVSPRMRFDTVLNNLMAAAMTSGEVRVYSDGKPWRPVIHVQDIARSFLAVLEAPIELVHNQAFNNGANHLNHQVIDLAKIVVATVAGSRLSLTNSSGADQRTYKADFSKFAAAFPSFQFMWNAHTGAQELFEAFQVAKLTSEQFHDPKFTRLAWLNRLLAADCLDSDLRWCNQMALPRKAA